MASASSLLHDAWQPDTPAPAPAVRLPRAAPRPNPYAKLFVTPGTEAAPVKRPAPMFRAAAPRRDASTAHPKPKIVCGTTLIPADGRVDPGIFAPTGQSDGRFTMRAIEPPICR